MNIVNKTRGKEKFRPKVSKNMLFFLISAPFFARRKRFARGAQLVGDAKDNTFTVARYGEVHREHMRTYHVFFDLVQPEIALCVFCGARGVDKAVKAVTAVVLVPVVEKIIMQKRPAHE